VSFDETANWTQDIGDLEAYRMALPGTLRSTLARKGAKLARAGSGRFAVFAAPREAAAALAEFKEVYRSSWKPEEPYEGFIDGLVGLSSRQGWLRLGLLYIEDRPAAVQLWLVNEGTASIYKLAYDSAYRAWSPGTLLTMHMIEHVVREDGVTRLDYLTGDDAYKRDWMSSREMMKRICIANPRTARGIRVAATNALRAVKRRWLG
jgi:CelD/BcsL family acetyltransferase involved in cellulose biosynthesis